MRFYSLIAGASPWLGWAYMAVGSVAMLSAGGRILKGLRQDRGEIVFDGANVGESALGDFELNQSLARRNHLHHAHQDLSKYVPGRIKLT